MLWDLTRKTIHSYIQQLKKFAIHSVQCCGIGTTLKKYLREFTKIKEIHLMGSMQWGN